MLKRNLIIVAFITLVLALSANSFGQNSAKSTTSKSKFRKKVNRVNMEDGVFLPGYRTSNKRKKMARKVRNFNSTTQPFADGRVKRKKPKKTNNLLPYLEQDNIYRKRKRNK